MYREFNSDAEFCIVTPEEHEAFDKVVVPILNYEVNQALHMHDVSYEFQRLTWVGPLQEKFGCAYLFCSKTPVGYETAVEMYNALKERVRKENDRDINYMIRNAHMLDMFTINWCLHSNCREDNWNGWSRNEYMLDPCRKLLHDGAWVKWGREGRIATPVVNNVNGKDVKTFVYTNIAQEENLDPKKQYNYAVFSLPVDVPRSPAVMDALRKVWPKEQEVLK